MKKYGNDYRQRGKQFEYTGKWYGSSLSVKELKRHALNNTGLMAAALVIYFASLMLNNEGSRIFWILLPYMVVVFPVSYGIMGGASLFLFCRQQEGKADHSQVVIPEEHIGHMTCAQYEKGVRRPVRCSKRGKPDFFVKRFRKSYFYKGTIIRGSRCDDFSTGKC